MAARSVVAAAVVIDISAKAAADRDYRLTSNDVLEFEKKAGAIREKTFVLLRTGWSRYWPEAKPYLGDDTPGDASTLSFPGYGEDAAKLLVEERRVAALGIDTASMDYGRSTEFKVHQIAAARNAVGRDQAERKRLGHGIVTAHSGASGNPDFSALGPRFRGDERKIGDRHRHTSRTDTPQRSHARRRAAWCQARRTPRPA